MSERDEALDVAVQEHDVIGTDCVYESRSQLAVGGLDDEVLYPVLCLDQPIAQGESPANGGSRRVLLFIEGLFELIAHLAAKTLQIGMVQRIQVSPLESREVVRSVIPGPHKRVSEPCARGLTWKYFANGKIRQISESTSRGRGLACRLAVGIAADRANHAPTMLARARVRYDTEHDLDVVIQAVHIRSTVHVATEVFAEVGYPVGIVGDVIECQSTAARCSGWRARNGSTTFCSDHGSHA